MDTPTDLAPTDCIPPAEPPPEVPLSGPRARFVRSLLARGLVPREDWDAVSASDRQAVLAAPGRAAACDALASLKLLTPYQAGRLRAGQRFGLVLGGYRVLDRLGAGGTGVVFRAENLYGFLGRGQVDQGQSRPRPIGSTCHGTRASQSRLSAGGLAIVYPVHAHRRFRPAAR